MNTRQARLGICACAFGVAFVTAMGFNPNTTVVNFGLTAFFDALFYGVMLMYIDAFNKATWRRQGQSWIKARLLGQSFDESILDEPIQEEKARQQGQGFCPYA